VTFSREFSGCFFGIDQIFINNDFKNSARRGDQVNICGELLFNLVCQTDSAGAVASLIAVFNTYFHLDYPSYAR
jgi:hypothetical protein